MASENFRGIVLMVLSMALFAVEDMFLKWAVVDLPVGQVVFASGAFGALVFVLIARSHGHGVFVAAARHPAVVARNIGEMVGTLGYVIALSVVPLTTVSAVLQALPLAITLGAALFMSEQVGWRRWTAIALGFLGVMLVIQPTSDGFSALALWVLVTVAGLALRDLAARMIPKSCSNAQVSAWGMMAVSTLGILMMAFSGGVRMPDGWETLVLVGALVFGTAGYWAIIAATRTGEVSVVAPFRYTRLVFAMAIGATVFGERPNALTLIGAAIIILSGIYAYAREQARKKAQKQTLS